jgi:hypothetical protein
MPWKGTAGTDYPTSLAGTAAVGRRHFGIIIPGFATLCNFAAHCDCHRIQVGPLIILGVSSAVGGMEAASTSCWQEIHVNDGCSDVVM